MGSLYISHSSLLEIKSCYLITMATQTNQQIFSGGLAKVLEEQWQVDVRLKAGVDNDDDSAISAHKLILVSFLSLISYSLLSDLGINTRNVYV